jgi:transposase InsO family protein
VSRGARLRFTAAEIAETLVMALSTVSGILTRRGYGRLVRLRLEQPVRYEGQRPGEFVHVDIKQLGRIEGGAGKRAFGGERRQRHNPRHTDAEGIRRHRVGHEYVHVCVDDFSRLAYAEVLPDQKTTTAIGFLRRAIAFYHRHGIRVERLLTDNGSAYVSTRHALACRDLGIWPPAHPALPPQPNGKAERFIRTLVAGWAYGAIYRSSQERTAALDGWLASLNRNSDRSPSPSTPRNTSWNSLTSSSSHSTGAVAGVGQGEGSCVLAPRVRLHARRAGIRMLRCDSGQ